MLIGLMGKSGSGKSLVRMLLKELDRNIKTIDGDKTGHQSHNDSEEKNKLRKYFGAVDVAVQNGCHTMVRGLRDLTDFASEKQLAELNLIISDGNVNIISLFANPQNTTIFSTSVKELFALGKDIDSFVHPLVK